MKVTLRLPSDAVKFGYIEVEAEDIDSLPEPEALGMFYVHYMAAYRKAEQRGLNDLLGADVQSAEAKVEVPPGDREAAVQRLEDGRKPRTVDEAKLMEQEAVRLLTEELEASVVEVVEHEEPAAEAAPEPAAKPWEKRSAPKAKPWEAEQKVESEGPALAIADINW